MKKKILSMIVTGLLCGASFAAVAIETRCYKCKYDPISKTAYDCKEIACPASSIGQP